MSTQRMVALVGLVMNCGPNYLDVYTCDHPDPTHLDARSQPDPCHEHDDAGPGDAGDGGVTGDAGDAGG